MTVAIEVMRTWTFDHVRPPGEGPWTDEPDKAQWIDPATDFDCLIVRGDMTGALCGYVGVPPGHVWHTSPHALLRPWPKVHGGLNYADFCAEGAEDGYGVCHVPAPGRPKEVWWFGFHCAYGTDYSPTMMQRLSEMLGRELEYERQMRQRYRTFDYVVANVRLLAAQLRVEPRRIWR